MKRFFKYFLQGLLFLIPVGVTIYLVYVSVNWVDKLIPSLIFDDNELGPDGQPQNWIPGVGLLFVISIITFVGFLGSTLIARPAFSIVENTLYKLPVVNLIFSVTKDFINAFIGDKKKFNQPVLVKLNKEYNIYRLGFITQGDMGMIDHPELVAVYFPHSYNISGNLSLIPHEHIMVLEAPSSEIMKFIVSGGVSGMEKIVPTKTTSS